MYCCVWYATALNSKINRFQQGNNTFNQPQRKRTRNLQRREQRVGKIVSPRFREVETGNNGVLIRKNAG